MKNIKAFECPHCDDFRFLTSFGMTMGEVRNDIFVTVNASTLFMRWLLNWVLFRRYIG